MKCVAWLYLYCMEKVTWESSVWSVDLPSNLALLMFKELRKCCQGYPWAFIAVFYARSSFWGWVVNAEVFTC